MAIIDVNHEQSTSSMATTMESTMDLPAQCLEGNLSMSFVFVS